MLVTKFDKVCSILPPPHYSQDAALQWHKSFHHEAHVCWTQQFVHGRWISLALQQALLQWCRLHYVSVPSLSSVHHASHKQTLIHPAAERMKANTFSHTFYNKYPKYKRERDTRILVCSLYKVKAHVYKENVWQYITFKTIKILMRYSILCHCCHWHHHHHHSHCCLQKTSVFQNWHWNFLCFSIRSFTEK